MNRLLKITALCLVVMLPAAAIAKSYAIKHHGRWSSRIIISGKSALFRASTTAYRNNELVALTFDRRLKRCTSQVITMNFKLDRRANRTFTSPNRFGKMRIDRRRLHNITYKMSTDSGSKYGYVKVTNFGEGARILRELGYGKTVRFKLSSSSGKGYFFNFGLHGYRIASRRARSLCIAFKRKRQQRRDKRYFPTQPAKRSDKDYFL